MKLRNIIVNNLKLLNDDISKAFIRIQSAPSAKKDYLANENKKEVLYMYRHMLKHIPPMFNRKLERVHHYEV